MTLPVLVNRAGGAAAAAGERLQPDIEAAFEKAGTRAQVRLLSGGEIAAAVREAAGRCERIAVAGGDGSLSCAAGALADLPDASALAILPLGTLNHLARDLGIPADLAEAAALAAHGSPRAIDVGRVNDHVFVNNASIGLYPLMVRNRDAARERHGLPKWLATLPAAWTALRRLPHHRLRLHIAGRERAVVTPLLFVGNNDYSLDAGTLGRRESLEDGRLSVFAVGRQTRRGLIWFAARTLAGRVDRHEDFETLGNLTTMDVRGHGSDVRIAIDGEVMHLAFPLAFSVAPKALRVIAP
ncbi:MAG: hypothetical protein JOY99_14400 [Sphingomonadaceae bacterium]|nr:hypothetical protein [Sphingomonadaceae bacterium]